MALAGEWHVEKPISAIHDQIQLRKQFGRHSFAVGAYLAHYTQENHWNFTDVLTDVRDNPRFLDVVTTTGGVPDTLVTSNGFRNFLSNYVNGTGETNVVSGVVGGEIQLTDQLRADLGVRVEYNNYVQASENTVPVDLDGDPATTFNNIEFGNNTFRHFTHDITDWAGSLGLNYMVNDNLAVFAAGSRGYKMPALDELLEAQEPGAGGPVRRPRGAVHRGRREDAARAGGIHGQRLLHQPEERHRPGRRVDRGPAAPRG